MSSKQWLVTFKDGTSEADRTAQKQAVTKAGGRIIHDYDETGFAAEIPDSCYQQNFQSLAPNGPIEFVEPNGTVTTQART